MKALFTGKRPAPKSIGEMMWDFSDLMPLTLGKIYDVLELKDGENPQELKRNKVKNDLGNETWYKESYFKIIPL